MYVHVLGNEFIQKLSNTIIHYSFLCIEYCFLLYGMHVPDAHPNLLLSQMHVDYTYIAIIRIYSYYTYIAIIRIYRYYTYIAIIRIYILYIYIYI